MEPWTRTKARNQAAQRPANRAIMQAQRKPAHRHASKGRPGRPVCLQTPRPPSTSASADVRFSSAVRRLFVGEGPHGDCGAGWRAGSVALPFRGKMGLGSLRFRRHFHAVQPARACPVLPLPCLRSASELSSRFRCAVLPAFELEGATEPGNLLSLCIVSALISNVSCLRRGVGFAFVPRCEICELR